MSNSQKNKILVCIDGSYFMYYTLFGAVAEFQKKEPQLASTWIKPAEETDQSNIPNLLNCDRFRVILKRFVMKRIETIDWRLRGTFQDQIDLCDGIDFVFALDDRVSKNFRRDMYPEYKGQRAVAKKSFNTSAIHDYIINVLFKELEIEEKYHYHLVKVNGAEGDDVIATLFKNFSNQYSLNVLFASDHDFVQLENVYQMDLFGKKVECKVADQEVTKEEYLLNKIILGDVADNIKKVFTGVGPKKSLAMIRNREILKKRLAEDQEAAKRFLLNESLISFSKIPKELNDRIVEQLNLKLYSNDVLNDQMDLASFMTL